MAIQVDIQNRVRLQPKTDARVQAFDQGQDQIGRAVAGFGQQLSQAVEQQDRINEVYDTAAAKKVMTDAMVKVAEAKRTYKSLQGFDAVDAPTKFRADLDKTKSELSASLANDRQRRMFQDVFDRQSLSDFTEVSDYADKHVFAAGRAADIAFGETHLTRAVDLAIDNPDEAQASLATVEATIRKVNSGAGEAVIAQKIAQTKSTWARQVAQGLIQSDVLEAKEWVDKHAATLLPEDETALRKEMRPNLEEAEGDIDFGKIVARSEGAEPDAEDPVAAQDESAAIEANPVRGKQTSGFYDKRDGGKRQHSALDIATPAGTPVHPPAAGKVIKAWNDKAGGNSVLVQHPDGRVTGYAHLRNINVDVGDSVTPSTVLGGVGNTGTASKGNHLHYTVRNKDGNRVDPAGQKWKQGDLVTRPGAGRLDAEALYSKAERLAKEENWDQKRLDRAYARIDQRLGQADRLKARAEEDASDAAWERVNAIEADGGTLTSVSQIPGFGRLPAKVQMQLRAEIKRNVTGEAVQAGGDTYFELLEASGNAQTQSAFASADLNAVRGQMSKGEFNSLRRAQVAIRNGGGADGKTAANFGRIDSFVRRYAPEAGIAIGNNKQALSKENRAKRATLTERVRAEVDRRQAEANRQLTDAEMDAVVRAQTVAVFTPGVVEGGRAVELNGQRYTEVPRYQAGPGARGNVAAVPMVERRAIEAALRKAGRPVTNDAIIDLYLNAR